MVPWFLRRRAAAILVVPTAGDVAPLVLLCVGLGVRDLEVLAGERAAALAERLWSRGRFGLATAGLAALCGLAAAAVFLAASDLAAPVRRDGPWAMACVALGAAVSFMPAGLPLGAILETSRVARRRRRYEAWRRDGCRFMLVRGTESAVAQLMWAAAGHTIDARRCRP